MIKRVLTLLVAGVLALPLAAEAQKTIKVGMPMPLSGPPALFGDPASKGAQMFVDELNAKGGVLGRKIELIVRDSKADANEAVRVARELILKDNVDFLVGTLTSAEGPAVSVVAKENKVVFIAPIPKTDQLTAADKLHPYVFRVSANTTMEGRSAAEIVAKWPVTKVATISFDYAYGQDVTKAFVEHLKKVKPSAQIVDQQWPKLGEQDYNPFINAQMGKKPEAIFSSIWGGFFVTYSKQAKALGVFDAVKYNFIGVGEAGSPETTKSMGKDYPVGIWGNSY
ncbi:MAG TPA: ABC transporter substrate-binding protein, partial [Methylomirabilota bacterium]|nr:ABC transporter substrate-binding protein [Methylomirabilota bacterium]